jgi:hypothetical protein
MAKLQRRTISHTGDVLGEENVELRQNIPRGVSGGDGSEIVSTGGGYDDSTALADRGEPIISFECPREFESLRYDAAKHWTKLVLRTRTVKSVTEGAIDVGSNLTPVAGEEEIEDQPFPVIRAVETLREPGSDGDGPLSEEIAVTDVDYAQNQVELGRYPDNDVALYPVISRGAAKYQGVNQLNQVEGPVSRWSTPLYRWSDFDQDKRGTEIKLDGSVRWTRNESIQLLVSSPEQVVWEDPLYPDSYVSQAEQLVEIEL